MQIVIDIDKKRFRDIQRISTVQLKRRTPTLEQVIASGTPLPKGHGRLIDADAYIDKYEECGWLDDITVDEFNAITPTIIEADKEKDVCKDCYYNDGEVHAECVICDKADEED